MEVAIGEGRSACKMEGRVVQRDQEDNYVEIEHHNSFIKADINFQALASKKTKDATALQNCERFETLWFPL